MSSVIPHQSGNEDPRPQLVISGHDGTIRALAYLLNGRRVVTSSYDGTVKIWNLENGEQEGTSMEHGCEVVSLAVTHDGTKIVSSDLDGSVKVWDVESHGLVREWIHKRGCMIAISTDDRLVAVGKERCGVVLLLQPHNPIIFVNSNSAQEYLGVSFYSDILFHFSHLFKATCKNASHCIFCGAQFTPYPFHSSPKPR